MSKFFAHILSHEYNDITYSEEQMEIALENYKNKYQENKDAEGFYSVGWYLPNQDIANITSEKLQTRLTHVITDIVLTNNLDALGRRMFNWYFNYININNDLIKIINSVFDPVKSFVMVSPLVEGELDDETNVLQIEKIYSFNIIGIVDYDDNEQFEDYDDD